MMNIERTGWKSANPTDAVSVEESASVDVFVDQWLLVEMTGRDKSKKDEWCTVGKIRCEI